MYDTLKEKFKTHYGREAEYIFSAPGRTELGGNHTDHQLGCVLAAAVNLDTKAAVAANDKAVINVYSEGYSQISIAINDLAVHPEEKGSTAALVRGVAAGAAGTGMALRGFDAYIVSDVLVGSGLSSSAAFEVLIGTIIEFFAGAGHDAVKVAQLGQYAENVYFGKPSGLMDQMASSVGNVVAIDFADSTAPCVQPLSFDFAATGHALCIIDSGADHADLTHEYAAIPNELKNVCAVFGKTHLREVEENEFYARLAEVRQCAGDRAVLRAIHIFNENRRVQQQTEALTAGDFDAFLRLVAESGRSSWMYLQNVIPAGSTANQQLAFALAAAEHLLAGRGACRVHGGGFAGTIQAFVPVDMLDEFRTGIEAVLGSGKCHILNIRREGGCVLEGI